MMPIELETQFGKPRDFDLMHGSLYAKAKKALDQKMKDATKAGVKSSVKEKDELEPTDVREIYLKSNPNNPRHVQQCAFIGLGVSRAARACAEWLEETQFDLVSVKDDNAVFLIHRNF